MSKFHVNQNQILDSMGRVVEHPSVFIHTARGQAIDSGSHADMLKLKNTAEYKDDPDAIVIDLEQELVNLDNQAYMLNHCAKTATPRLRRTLIDVLSDAMFCNNDLNPIIEQEAAQYPA